jgi:hypothetical protein
VRLSAVLVLTLDKSFGTGTNGMGITSHSNRLFSGRGECIITLPVTKITDFERGPRTLKHFVL